MVCLLNVNVELVWGVLFDGVGYDFVFGLGGVFGWGCLFDECKWVLVVVWVVVWVGVVWCVVLVLLVVYEGVLL